MASGRKKLTEASLPLDVAPMASGVRRRNRGICSGGFHKGSFG